jgi:hypothetical protein
MGRGGKGEEAQESGDTRHGSGIADAADSCVQSCVVGVPVGIRCEAEAASRRKTVIWHRLTAGR